MSPETPSQVQTLACPNCGAPLTVRSMGRAVTIVCGHCNSILDAKDPQLKILQRFKAATEGADPLIPLGSRGKWRGALYEAIGFQVRSMEADGITYSWREISALQPVQGISLPHRIQRPLERLQRDHRLARGRRNRGQVPR